MKPPAVSDAGPLHYLILLDLIEILPNFFQPVLVPEEVRRELLHPNAPRFFLPAPSFYLYRRGLRRHRGPEHVIR